MTKKLHLNLLNKIPDSSMYEIDRYKVYEFLDINKHNVKKFEKTKRNEGLHSFLRNKIVSLRRETKGYNKGIKSLRKYLFLIFVFWGLI